MMIKIFSLTKISLERLKLDCHILVHFKSDIISESLLYRDGKHVSHLRGLSAMVKFLVLIYNIFITDCVNLCEGLVCSLYF